MWVRQNWRARQGFRHTGGNYKERARPRLLVWLAAVEPARMGRRGVLSLGSQATDGVCLGSGSGKSGYRGVVFDTLAREARH